MNVLITSASRKVTLVQAFQAALAKEGGGRVVACDLSRESPALYKADEFVLSPPSNDEKEYCEFLESTCRRLDVRCIVPTRDEELAFFARKRASFKALGITVAVSGEETVLRCRDKRRFAAFCNDHGIRTPIEYDPKDIPGSAWPVLVKPRTGKSGQGIGLCRSRKELEAFGPCEEMICQEVLSGPEYSIDVFSDFTAKPLSVVPRERTAVFGGESYVSRTVELPKVVEEAVRLAGLLELHGHAVMQCFLIDGEPVFIEVNPRYGGASALSFAAGADSPRMLIRLAEGKDPVTSCEPYRRDLYMLRYAQDMYIGSDEMGAG